MEKEALDLSAKRFDIFTTLLGLLMMGVSGYLWLNYLFGLETDIGGNFDYIIMLILVVFFALFGLFFFIKGYSQMMLNYDIEKTLMQIQAITSLEKLKGLKLSDLGLSKKSISKFRKYLKQRLKDLIEGFE